MNHTTNYNKETLTIGDLELTLFLINEKAYKSRETLPTIFHSHFFTEVFICKSGEFTLTTELGLAKLFPYDVAIMPQNHSHYLRCDSGHGAEFFSFGIMGIKTANKDGASVFEEIKELFTARTARIYRQKQSATEEMSILLSKKRSASLTFIKLIGALLEIKDNNDFEALDAKHFAIEDGEEAKGIDFMHIEDIINTYYTEKINYEELAARLHISRRHLDRIVRAKYGRTLREMIYISRINLAKKLLDDGDDGIDLIAIKTGFQSTAAFRSSFIALTGMTPTEYKNQK